LRIIIEVLLFEGEGVRSMRWGDILCGCLMFAMGGFALWMLIGMLRDKIGFTERFSDRTTAWLASTKRVEAIYTRNHGIFRHAIDAKYEYMVEGRKYTRAHRFFDTTFSGVPRKATVVYQKKRPERAYLESFSGPTKKTPLDVINYPPDNGPLIFLIIGTALFFAVGLQFFFR